GKSWIIPRTPVFSLTTQQLDSVPAYVDLREPQIFQHGQIRALVDPRRLEYGVPVRSDLLVLQLLKDNLGTRPLYIARTTGGYLQALGLEPYGLIQGLATKIMPVPVVTRGDTIAVPGYGHLDMPRSVALWNGYGAPGAIVRRGDWVDRPSVGIPVTYVATALLLGDAYERQGKPAEAERVRRRGVEIAQATRTLDLFVGQGRAVPSPNAPAGDVPRGVPIPARP
ncbi:MAG: hypothetical protein ACJ8AD_16035, partial [Gemmatimonadaceae bacterium]